MTREERDKLRKKLEAVLRYPDMDDTAAGLSLKCLAALEAAERDRDQWRHRAREMLAVLCRDGGHRTEEIGPDAAMEEGVRHWCAMVEDRDRLRAALERIPPLIAWKDGRTSPVLTEIAGIVDAALASSAPAAAKGGE